jgi:alcohol dehydrogenase
MAIEQSMLGAAHSAANPLTAHCGVIHGVAVGLMLPHVVRFNAADPQVRPVYAELAVAAGLGEPDAPADRLVLALIQRLEALLDAASMPRSLKPFGVDSPLVPILAREAAAQWTARFNPVPIQAADFAGLYEAALAGR